MTASTATAELDQRCINTIRVLSADVVEKANSGHPGAPMGMAVMAYTLYSKFMRHAPLNPRWVGRDRFVLSNGHASALLYTLQHLCGYPALTMEQLQSFRQLDSLTAGHPESHLLASVEVTTGPLGQGISNAVGLALAERQMAATFNRPGFEVIDNYTYVFCGDGCLQEGISSEASSLAGHLGLGRLVVLYDDNHITIDGDTQLSFSEDVLRRYEAYGWHVQHVHNGNDDVAAVAAAIEAARGVADRPSLIKVTTTIGFGSAKQGTGGVHGAPLGKDDLAAVKRKFGFDPEQKFVVPAEVRAAMDATKRGEALEAAWKALYERYAAAHPELAAQLQRRLVHQLPAAWRDALPRYQAGVDAAKATRQTSEAVINALWEKLPELIGGSADLTHSNLTKAKSAKAFQAAPDTHDGRYLYFGVREHAMAAICNGLSAYGGLLPFCATFMNFIGYAMGAVTLSALANHQVIYVMTHDSIGLGEDGPTHQPIEKYLTCRATPNLQFIRPADGNETNGAYVAAIEAAHRPTVLSLSRHAVPQLPNTSIDGVLKGAYTIVDAEGAAAAKPDVILTGSGTEVSIAVEAATALRAAGINARVVSFPCWLLFDAQPQAYKESVFVPGVPVLSIEAATTFGWSRYAHASLGLDTFGASAPAPAIYNKFGLTAANMTERAKQLVDFYKTRPVPHLLEKPF